ncbi:hypothetical protein DKX38_019997 [Salix brachista]|uniref:BHLH domain-containing protein n=1 Tax=Salix brachista TaxID=2182728 RepID=A0A5N5KI34_9ROSI|nr:hypothetical protein DKX38_019997 [Salix brachista]
MEEVPTLVNGTSEGKEWVISVGFMYDLDMQTNTADMLEEAVDYVKFLQKQIQCYKLKCKSKEMLVFDWLKYGRNSRNSKENANAWLENNKEALPAHCSV